MSIKELNAFRSLFRTEEPYLPVPVKNASMKGKISTLGEDRVQFVPLVLSALFTNGLVKGSEGCDMSPTLKEIANAAASDCQSLLAGIPHPGSHGGNMGCMRDPLFAFGKIKRTNGSKFLFQNKHGDLRRLLRRTVSGDALTNLNLELLPVCSVLKSSRTEGKSINVVERKHRFPRRKPPGQDKEQRMMMRSMTSEVAHKIPIHGGLHTTKLNLMLSNKNIIYA